MRTSLMREARSGIERQLMRRAKQRPRLRLRPGLGTITVMDIEIDNRDTFNCGKGQCMGGTNGSIAEEQQYPIACCGSA